jgi:peptide/nickel transport system ATP-binding protein
MNETPILEVENLEKHFQQSDGFIDRLIGDSKYIKAVDDVSLRLHENDVKGVIGESGCGKTTLLMTLMGLTPPTGGEIYYEGDPVSGFDRADWKEFRRNIQIVFQDPFNSLDPKMSVRETLLEPLQIHNVDDKHERIIEALDRVELNPPERYIDSLPQQLSGGELQRVSLARALVLEPSVLLADEPVSMLDVSTQAAVLNLLSELVDELDMSVVYISHDLSTVSYICDTINVMYLGRIVESAETMDIIDSPEHPYTQELINAIPIPDPHHERSRTQLEDVAPDPIDLGEGCRFKDRCPERMDVCDKTPRTVETDDDRSVACHLYYDHEAEARGHRADDADAAGNRASHAERADGGVHE